jgi:hypothetical protein
MSSAENNPARLKLGLAIKGVATQGAFTEGEWLDLVIGDDVWARARVDETSPICLHEGPPATVAEQDTRAPVRIVAPPEFATRRNARGIALGDIAAIHGTYATVALGGGCGRGAAGRTCAICQGRELTEQAGQMWPVDEVVEAVRAAFEEGDAEFVHIVLGYFPGDDAGVAVLRPYLNAVRHHFDTIVAVTMHPPADQRAIDLTYAEGVDVLCYNLEAPEDDSLRRYFPGRARFFGRERYFKALAHAARIFPRGSVWSELMIDLAPRDAIARAIEELAQAGVIPTLGIMRAPGLAPPALDHAAALGASALDAVTRAGLSFNWLRDVSVTFTPLDARYLVPDAQNPTGLFHQLSRNRLGALTARSLARLRRRLRVRRVRASFDSSHL